MKSSQSRLFYGWWIVAASFFILLVSVGAGLYAPPVFLVPLQEHFGWSRAAIAAGGAIAAVVSGALSPLVGVWIDRYGARRVMTFGALVMGCAFALLGLMRSIWHLYAINVVAAVGITCVAWLPNQTLISNWFDRRRGLAMGIALAGIGFGGLAIAPMAATLIAEAGWRVAYFILSSMIFLIVATLALTVIRSGPQDLGLLPDGMAPAASSEVDPTDAKAGAPTEPLGIEWRDAFSTSAFWMLSASNFLTVFAGFSIIGHVVAFLTDEGFGSQPAASSLGIAIGVSVVGRMLFGVLADRYSKKFVMASALGFQGASTLCLLTIHSPGAIEIFVVVFGLGLGGGAVLLPLFVGECFGLRSFGRILGVLMISSALGGAIGPVLTGRIFDVSGSYTIAFVLHLAAFAISAALVSAVRRPVVGKAAALGSA